MRIDDDLAESDQFLHDQLADARVGTSVDITSSADDGTGQVHETTVRYTVQEILPDSPEGEMAASTDGRVWDDLATPAAPYALAASPDGAVTRRSSTARSTTTGASRLARTRSNGPSTSLSGRRSADTAPATPLRSALAMVASTAAAEMSMAST